MAYHKSSLKLERYNGDITVEIGLYENSKRSEESVNKALVIAMNYLLENMETDKQEEPE